MRVGLFSLAASQFVNAIHRTLDRRGHQLAVLVTSRPDGRGGPLSALALRRAADVDPSIPILVTNRLEPIRAALAGFELDLVLVQAFPRRLPPSLLAIPRLGCVNIHPSSLPRYRGPDPVGWQFYNGEPHLGVTFHRMDADLDTGPVLLQWKTRIRAGDNRQSLRRTIHRQVVRRLPRLLRLVESGAPGLAQDDAEATDAPRFTERERTIDWGRSARDIVNQVRAIGDAGAAAMLDGRDYRIMRAEALRGPHSAPAARTGHHPPGTVIRATDDSLIITTGRGLLRATSFRTH